MGNRLAATIESGNRVVCPPSSTLELTGEALMGEGVVAPILKSTMLHCPVKTNHALRISLMTVCSQAPVLFTYAPMFPVRFRLCSFAPKTPYQSFTGVHFTIPNYRHFSYGLILTHPWVSNCVSAYLLHFTLRMPEEHFKHVSTIPGDLKLV